MHNNNQQYNGYLVIALIIIVITLIWQAIIWLF